MAAVLTTVEMMTSEFSHLAKFCDEQDKIQTTSQTGENNMEQYIFDSVVFTSLRSFIEPVFTKC